MIQIPIRGADSKWACVSVRTRAPCGRDRPKLPFWRLPTSRTGRINLHTTYRCGGHVRGAQSEFASLSVAN